MRQTEEWYLHIFHAKAVKVCDVSQEKLLAEGFDPFCFYFLAGHNFLRLLKLNSS
jgi:hypothetical protein